MDRASHRETALFFYMLKTYMLFDNKTLQKEKKTNNILYIS